MLSGSTSSPPIFHFTITSQKLHHCITRDFLTENSDLYVHILLHLPTAWQYWWIPLSWRFRFPWSLGHYCLCECLLLVSSLLMAETVSVFTKCYSIFLFPTYIFAAFFVVRLHPLTCLLSNGMWTEVVEAISTWPLNTLSSRWPWSLGILVVSKLKRDTGQDEISSTGHFRKGGSSVLMVNFWELPRYTVCCEVSSVMEVGRGGLLEAWGIPWVSLKSCRGLYGSLIDCWSVWWWDARCRTLQEHWALWGSPSSLCKGFGIRSWMGQWVVIFFSINAWVLQANWGLSRVRGHETGWRERNWTWGGEVHSQRRPEVLR